MASSWRLAAALLLAIALRAASEHDCPSPPYFKLPEDDAAPGSPVASAKGLNGAAESGGDAGEGEADPAATIELLHLHDGVPGGAAQADAEPELQEETFITRFMFEVFGKVQGVFFRATTKERADQLGVVGVVRNSLRGTVVGYAEGPEAVMERFRIFLCEEGSPASEIERCELTEADAPPPDLALDAFVVDYEDAP